MSNHLRPISFYENLYDHITVGIGRSRVEDFKIVHHAWFEAMPDEPEDSARSALPLNKFFIAMVGVVLLDRYDNRESAIQEMMEVDRLKDERIAIARFTHEPLCRHCKQRGGLRIFDKVLHQRRPEDSDEQVLFMTTCSFCKKRSAYWEDSSAWILPDTLCPKCQNPMTKADKKLKASIVTTYRCESCGHSYKEKLELESTLEKPDPHYEADRELYCLLNDKVREEWRAGKRRFAELDRVLQEVEERQGNKTVYDAIAKIEKLKIADLQARLAEAVKSEGYVEFELDKPEMGKYAIVEFHCLDSKPNRSDHDSRKELEKATKASLDGSNWRLMNDGASVRLGYLTGRLKAYESEDDLKGLVTELAP